MKTLLFAAVLLFAGASLAAKEAKPPKNPDKGEKGDKGDKKNDKKNEEKEQPISWREKLVPGPAVLLRVKREPGKFLIYDGTLTRTQSGSNSYTENNSFYLTVLCADKREENIGGKNRSLDLLAIRRTFIERDREERLENGKTIKRVLENNEDLISIGPNYEIVGALRCHAYDDQNSAAYRTEHLVTLKDGRALRGRILSEDTDKIVFLTDTDKFDLQRTDVKSTALVPTPHVVLDESPHYIFPPFSELKKAPGDTWRFKVPVIIPLKQGNPPQVLPTQFNAVVTCRLCEVKQVAGSPVATIEYRVSGAFDSSGDEFVSRFPEDFQEENRIVHKMSGEGVLLLDLDKGRIVEKTESFSFNLYGKSKVVQGADKAPKEVENQIQLDSRYQIRLMLPGTKMKNGKVIPSYD